MSKINSNFKIYFYFVLIIVCCIKQIKCNDANVFDSSGFEQAKYDLLQTGSKANDSCSIELRAIKFGVNNAQDWALKIVDSWGKFPSGIFSGNLYELGGFSECLNIHRNGEKYKTQYCLGQLVLEVDGDTMDKILNTNGEPIISPEYVLPQPANGVAITFGLCLPKVCSLRSIEPLMNLLISQKVNKVSVKMIDNTCQFEESTSVWRPIDLIAITFLGIILCLMVTSTCYDIICRINSRERSQAFSAFSVYTNGKKLLSYKKSKSSEIMDCLHGIRVISTCWIVWGHTVGMYPKLPMINLVAIPAFIKEYRSMLVFSAPIAVDTFFVMSGLLVSIGSLKALGKTGKLNLLLMYFHRIIRLTPLLALCVLLSVSLFRFMGSGPLWPHMTDVISEQCEKNWWSTLLYIQNYMHPNDMCYIYSWYLAVDMQLYFIAPAIMYLIYRFKAKAISALVVLILSCIACTLSVHVDRGLKTLRQNDKWVYAYYPTHIRFSSWLIGVIAGYFFFKSRKSSINIPRMFNLFAWTLSLTSMVIIIFINYPLTQLDSKSTPLEFGLYDALSRVIWAIAMCYIIFACINNYGGPINSILAHPLWQPLSRLCYSIYLMHFFVIRITMASVKSSLYFGEFIAFQAFIGNFVLTVFISLAATLAFESPMVTIEKMIFKPNQTTTKPNTEMKINPVLNSKESKLTEQKET